MKATEDYWKQLKKATINRTSHIREAKDFMLLRRNTSQRELQVQCNPQQNLSCLLFFLSLSFFFFLVAEINKPMLKSIWKYKEHRIAETALKKQSTSQFQNYYEDGGTLA